MLKERSLIGRYEIITLLAHGGMAEIYLAQEHGLAGLQRIVVIKKLLPQFARDPEFIEMFLREARIAAKIQHPNIVGIFDLGKDDNIYYIAMEYIRGSTAREIDILTQKVGSHVPLNIAVSIVIGALKGLHVAHEMLDDEGRQVGLIHRDISPHNIMCTSEGHIKLLDFGVAKATSVDVEATYSGNLKGKFAYMSPEQCLRKALDRRTDIFSMGVVLWELCSGERLFKRESEIEMMQAVTSGLIKIPKKRFPPGLSEILAQALNANRDRRFYTAEIFRYALLEFAKTEHLDLSEDALGAYVKSVSGEQLALRDDALKSALEHSLSTREAYGLMQQQNAETESLSQNREFDADRSAETRVSAHLGHRDKKPNKKRILAAIILGGLFMVSGLGFIAWKYSTADAPRVFLGAAVKIAWAPTIDPKILRSETSKLIVYLSEKLERPVELGVPYSYQETAEKLISGKVDFAVLPPLLYLQTVQRKAGIQAIAMKMYQGSKYSDGLLLVASSSRFKKLEDLKGKTFCFTDKNSTTGNFLPRLLFEKNGFDLDTFAGKIIWSGDHIQVIRDLLSGECDASATYSGALIAATYSNIPVAQLRTLAITGHTPQDVVCAGKNTESKLVNEMKKSLLSLDPQKEWKTNALGEVVKITGFAPIDEDDFSDLKEILERKKDR